jgi:3-oxoacyl-[acyl-carrier protein] reductase
MRSTTSPRRTIRSSSPSSSSASRSRPSAFISIQAVPVATWGGVIGFARTLSLEVARDNINVSTIFPGYIETQRLEKVFAAGGEDPQVVRRQLEAEVPMGRIGTVEDIPGLVALLVSARGRYITGATIQVDGGLLRAVR